MKHLPLQVFMQHFPEHTCFIPFQAPLEGIAVPETFTFPFYYEPHPLSRMAVEELQAYLQNQNDFEHNFGLIPGQPGLVIGKMFGVLVVQDQQGNLGYLRAFSGKLADSNHIPGFVPPVFDMLTEEGFFKKEEQHLNAFNRRIEAMEANAKFLEAQEAYQRLLQQSEQEISDLKNKNKDNKKERKTIREKAFTELASELYQDFNDQLTQESLSDNYQFKDLNRYWKKKLAGSKAVLDKYVTEIEALKAERRQRSNALQQRLFDQYTFFNARLEEKSLWHLFKDTAQHRPPAGAGECAAPKLLQYAYLHDLKPIAMAEFWWGASPKSEVRNHKQYYPACRGKCEPILGHMLQGLNVDENPMLQNPAEGKEIAVVYEDEHLLIVNKPAEFLSVPGKTITDSVYLRMKQRFPEATGPLVVHRLDMSTSGLMLIAKTQEVHKKLQSQFIKRSIRKTYVALLDGEVSKQSGLIDLPLRVDLDDRPRQLVCYEHGKSARTQYEVLSVENGHTRIAFHPITGRTHQLRVHAAHQHGLNCPIVGDDLYGSKADRLHLHAQTLTFTHPVSKEEMTVSVDAEF